ncbi:hypothetical protein ACFV98_15330 [Streptomyces violascens]|uniref:hypothetical protein n=1 Tax=Streptomyces violascens TaxID=67381 RepID=UPI00365D8F0E
MRGKRQPTRRRSDLFGQAELPLSQGGLDGGPFRVPDWPGVAALATAPGAAPLRLRPAWDTVRMSFSTAPDHSPAGGISLGDAASAKRAARQ